MLKVFCVVGLAALVSGVAFWLFGWTRPPAHPEFEQVKVGMPLEGVETVMGRPDDKCSLMFGIGVNSGPTSSRAGTTANG